MTSDSSHEFGITIGGEKGFDLTNEHSYDIDVLSVEEFHMINDGVHTGTVTTEKYRDYSDDTKDGESEDTGNSPTNDGPRTDDETSAG